MARNLSVLALFLVIPTTAAAQDMPLSQILIDGEGWKKVGSERPPQPFPEVLAGTRGPQGERPTCYAATGGTLYVGYANGRALIAFALDKEERNPRYPAPYAPLRVKRGAKGIEVTWLEVDRDGRIYAATPLGIQVFDPTGRLCGVMAAPGEVRAMAFDGDKLAVWIGETKYERKLRTEGVK